jgi:hypothetical protein
MRQEPSDSFKIRLADWHTIIMDDYDSDEALKMDVS